MYFGVGGAEVEAEALHAFRSGESGGLACISKYGGAEVSG
jgi:hypothetical protein